MKKLAIVVDENSNIASKIVEYFSIKNIEIKAVPLVEVEGTAFSDFDLVATINNKDLAQKLGEKVVNIHPSLLPAFVGENPIAEAIMYGAKVTGVSVHDSGMRIILQYPVLVGNLTHFDELEEKIYEVEGKIYPLVLEKLLRDEVFDFDDLFKTSHSGCGGNCGGCKGCKGEQEGEKK